MFVFRILKREDDDDGRTDDDDGVGVGADIA